MWCSVKVVVLFIYNISYEAVSPLANRLEKSVSVRLKRASLSLLLHASRFFWPASLPFSSRLLFFCRNPTLLHELSPKTSILAPETGNCGTKIKAMKGRAVVFRPRCGALARTRPAPNEFSHQTCSSAALQTNNTHARVSGRHQHRQPPCVMKGTAPPPSRGGALRRVRAHRPLTLNKQTKNILSYHVKKSHVTREPGRKHVRPRK